jgi:hypothetical protein
MVNCFVRFGKMIDINRILLGRCFFSLHLAPTHPLKQRRGKAGGSCGV